jgi:hypothetical protein
MRVYCQSSCLKSLVDSYQTSDCVVETVFVLDLRAGVRMYTCWNMNLLVATITVIAMSSHPEDF